MARTVEMRGARHSSGGMTGPPRRKVRVVVRRVEPWSVLKFSLLFYFCIMLIFLFGFAILYWVLGAIGVLDSLSEFIGGLYGDENFRFNGGWIFTWLFFLGLIGVVAWSLINLCVSFLYNLVSDVVGGIAITLDEKR